MAVLAVQRFVVMSDLPVSKSDEHESIGEQLSWAMGSFGLAPMFGVSSSGLPGKSTSRPGRQLARARRQLLECTPPAPPPSDTPLSLPPALPPATPPDQCDSGTLNDRLLTLGVVLAVALVLQLCAHILWKHFLNGRYYLHLPLNCANVDGDGKLSRGEQRKALSPPPSPPDKSGAQPNSPQGGARCRSLASTRSKGSLTNLVRSSKALLAKKSRPQGLRSGKLAPVPAGAPPLSKVSTAKFLLSLNRRPSVVRRGPSCNALASTSSPPDEPAAAAAATGAAAAAAGVVAAAAAAPPPRSTAAPAATAAVAAAAPAPDAEPDAQPNSPQGGARCRSLASTRSKGSLTNLVRSSKALLAKKSRPQGLRSGKLAPVPAGAPPLSKVSTAKFLLSLNRRPSVVRQGPSCNALARARSSRSVPTSSVASSSVASSSRAEHLGGHDWTADRDGRATGEDTTEKNQPEVANIRFYPFPSWLRWPTVPLYVCTCCLSGLVQSAFAGFSLCGQNFISIFPLAIVVVVLVLMWTQLVVFHCRHRQAMWRSNKQQPQQPDADKGLDRAQRWQRGEFAKDKSETCEPERTERLLAKPLLFFPRCAADAYESMAVTVLFRCRGDAKHAMAYHMGKLSAQLAVVALASSGTALAEGNSAASSLAISALVMQVGVFWWIVCGRPSVDRMDWLVHAASWGFDSAATALLVFPAWAESNGEEAVFAALLFALLGMALPMVKLVCDGLRTLYRLMFPRRAMRHAGGQLLDAKDEVDPGCMEREVNAPAMASDATLAGGSHPDLDTCSSLLSAAAPAPLRPGKEAPSLKAAIRTVQIAQHVHRKHTQRQQGLLDGWHAPMPEGLPPIRKTTADAFLSTLNAAACLDAAAAATAPALNSDLARSAIALFAPSVTASAPAAAPAPGVPRSKMTLKVAARTVQTTVHMERKLTRKRQGLREGYHLSPPSGLPEGLPEAEPGRLALRGVRHTQSFDRYLSPTNPRARVSDSGPIQRARQDAEQRHQKGIDRV